MHRSSPSIASLAAALAKAQAESVNPEKSLTATIRWKATARRALVALCAAAQRAQDRAQDDKPVSRI